eukprot:gene3091-3641_t
MSFRRIIVQKRAFSYLKTQHSALVQKLKLEPVNSGVYNGKWAPTAGAKLNTQVDPSNNEKLGEVSFGTAADYEATIAAMTAAQKDWQAVP